MDKNPSLRNTASQLLEDHWDDRRGWTVPNPRTYPHLWLWDSCFHAIARASLADERAVTELSNVLAGITSNGMVPHMRFGGAEPDTYLGPLSDRSSITQPPLYGLGLSILSQAGMNCPEEMKDRARRAFEWLWTKRRLPENLIYIVHPWEAGNDHSLRWDSWWKPDVTRPGYRREEHTVWNKGLMNDLVLDRDGSSVWSNSFVVAPAAFNAMTAYSMLEYGRLYSDTEILGWGRSIVTAIDEILWNPATGLWDDYPVVGGGDSCSEYISDGVLPALVTPERARARNALQKLTVGEYFGAEFGPSNVKRDHDLYMPDTYWRGPAWMPLNYFFSLCMRRWGLIAEANTLVKQSAAALRTSGWAEYWNPESGVGYGAQPQSWNALIVAMLDQ